MDRRRFLMTFFTTTTLTPMLLASKKSHNNCELLILSESPHEMLPHILRKLKQFHIPFGKNYAFLNSHPHKQELCHFFAQKGLTETSSQAQADITISFSHLFNPAIPSFTLIQDGKIWDIRTRRLRYLWREMNAQPQTTGLTTIGLKPISNAWESGEFATCYGNGQLLARFPLKGKNSKIIHGQHGRVSIQVEQGKAWVTNSSCPHQICRHSPPVSLSGERIICAPNGFLLEIQGRKSVDTVIG